MSDNIQSLWGELPEIDNSSRTPLQILREQAAIITKLTSGALKGKVSKMTTTNPSSFAYSLFIEAPSLGSYTVRVVDVVYPLEMFPLRLVDAVASVGRECATEDELIAALRGVLQSEKLRKLISALIVQVRGAQAMPA